MSHHPLPRTHRQLFINFASETRDDNVFLIRSQNKPREKNRVTKRFQTRDVRKIKNTVLNKL